MKLSLLLIFFTLAISLRAQRGPVAQLPTGTYHVESGTRKSFGGDIVLLDESHYKISTEAAVGDYKFSATAQRILFLSGTLKGAFARTISTGTDVGIVLPLKENEDIGFKLIQTDLQAFYKKD